VGTLQIPTTARVFRLKHVQSTAIEGTDPSDLHSLPNGNQTAYDRQGEDQRPTTETCRRRLDVCAPDLPGPISVGESAEEAIASIREAIAFHLEALRQAGDQTPEPRTRVAVIDAA
jgi:predicted RNase H-like HicB family nuclease